MGFTPNNARRCLCVALVLMMCNCYLSLVSSEASDSLDIKLLDRMSTCPVIKLRGLAKDQRRKKTRRLTLFEAYLWLSVMTFTQLLRSVVAFIAALLLRAGDVELNPGPTPPTSPTPSDLDGAEAAATIPRDTAQVAASNTLFNPELDPETPLPRLQIESQQSTPGSQDHVQSEREIMIAPAAAVPSIIAHGPQRFQNQKDESRQNDDSAVKHPPPQLSYKFPEVEQQEPQQGESVPVILVPEVPQVKAKEDIDSRDDDRMYREHDFGELQRVGSSVSRQEFVEWHQRQIMEMIGTNNSISENGDDWIKFVISANKLLRIGEDCIACPMCCIKKPSKIESHIFPRALLTVFKRIHCSNKKNEYNDFIYDFSRGVRMGPRALCYPMLCGSCEKLCDEESLRKLYIFLMDKPDKDCFRVPSDDFWLQRVLANIMFRGLIIADNLPEELQDVNFKRWFMALREHCKSSESIPNFRLFLLPNQSIDSGLIAFIYPFEYILRSPMFSTIIRDKMKEIRFIYTKFDCFHLVLPLDGKSDDYFNYFHEGLETSGYTKHRYIDLRWTLHGPGIYKRKFDRETKSVQYSASEQIKPSFFPEILLKVALDQYSRYLSMIYSHSDKSDLAAHCKGMIEFLPGLDHEYPSKDFSGATVRDIPEPSKQPGIGPSDVIFLKKLLEDDLSTMINKAAKISPFGLQQIKIEEHSAEITQTKEELAKKRKELRRKEDDMKAMKKVMENLTKVIDSAESNEQMERRKRRLLEVDLAQRNDHIRSIQDELIVYQQRLQIVHSLLSKERRERIRCQLEKHELKRQSKTVEKNLKDILIQISDDLNKLLQQDTTPELCNTLLQQCQKMLSILDKGSV